jgi:hypothetical protein
VPFRLLGLDAHPSQTPGRVGHPERIKASNRRTGRIRASNRKDEGVRPSNRRDKNVGLQKRAGKGWKLGPACSLLDKGRLKRLVWWYSKRETDSDERCGLAPDGVRILTFS